MSQRKIIVAIGGSSGSIYAKVLLDKLTLIQNQLHAVGIVMSDNARYNWAYELDTPFDPTSLPSHFKLYEKMDFMAPFASGSARYDTMIVCPCSMGLMARMATGISNDLVTRSADVVLKERRKLIIVPRDTPLSIIHINNMKILTEAGAIICPATPSFYSKPKTFEELAATVIDRVLDLADFDLKSYRWGEDGL